MINATPSEIEMWDKPLKVSAGKASDAEINEKYTAGEDRIVTETNREKIPNFVRALDKQDYMQVRPFYQRRQRWDPKRQSLLIESFIMNIPVPPLFLYEKSFNSYEVMDGQQRITALKSFYDGEFKLKGLEIWPELNGRSYSTLPSQIRSGLDRRSISYIVVLKESSTSEEDALLLRQTVFERLNTGGVKLESQEIRNCLFQSSFNNMLIRASRLDQFRRSFHLPQFSDDEEEPNAEIKKYTMYQKMDDVEMVLRFFALRHYDKFTRGMRGFLDLYMARARYFKDEDIEVLFNLFARTIELAREIYGARVFCPFDIETSKWKDKPAVAFYDAVMVGLAAHLGNSSQLRERKEEIVSATKSLFQNNESGTFTGRGNSKLDVEGRIVKYSKMLQGFTK